MKHLLLAFFLMPLFSKSQCPQYIGTDIATGVKIVAVVQKYTQFSMSMADTLENYNAVKFEDSAKFSTVIIRVVRTTQLVGTEVVQSAPIVKSFYIEGPAERIDKMINEYFIPAVEPCKTRSSPKWIYLNNQQQLEFKSEGLHHGIEMKSIYIEKL